MNNEAAQSGVYQVVHRGGHYLWLKVMVDASKVLSLGRFCHTTMEVQSPAPGTKVGHRQWHYLFTLFDCYSPKRRGFHRTAEVGD